MAFPAQPVVDSCVRANENPISLGGLWVDGGLGGFLQINGNQMSATTSGSALTGWVNIATSGDVECYVSVPTLPTGTELFYLIYRSSAASTIGPNGYGCYLDATSHIANVRFDGGAGTTLGYNFVSGSDGGAIDGFGIAAAGGTHQPYVHTVSTGLWSAAPFAVSDATYTSAGYFSLFTQNGTVARYTNIGLGPASSVPPGGGSGVFSGNAVPSSHSLDRGMYKAVARGIAR